MEKSETQIKCEKLGLRWVGRVGPSKAKIMLVGEALGAEEERLGEPFVGGAGHLLDSVLSISGIRRDSVVITNLVKVRPPNNDLGRLGELGLRLADFIPILREEVVSVNPNVVVALGGHALQALTPHQSIMQWRGSIIPSSLVEGVKVIPTIHPAAILRQYKWKPLFNLDMKRIKEEGEFKEINIPKRKLFIEPSMVEVKAFLDYVIERGGYCSFDIEVDVNGKMSCLSISPSPDMALSIPFRKGYGSYWTENEERLIWRWLTSLFQSEGIKFVAQNALFDMMWMVPRVGMFELYMDTMWAHQLCYAEIPKGLDTLASIYTKEPYYKDMRKVWKDQTITKQLWEYNAKDAAVTLEVALALEEELKSLRMEDFYFGFVRRLNPLLLKLQMRGMRVDMEGRKGLVGVMRKKKKEIEEELGGINPRSSKQMKELLYDKMGLKEMINHKTGKVSTGKEALRKLKERLEND